MKITVEQIAQMAAETLIHVAEHGKPDSMQIEEMDDPSERESRIALSLVYNGSYTQMIIFDEDGIFADDIIIHAD